MIGNKAARSRKGAWHRTRKSAPRCPADCLAPSSSPCPFLSPTLSLCLTLSRPPFSPSLSSFFSIHRQNSLHSFQLLSPAADSPTGGQTGAELATATHYNCEACEGVGEGEGVGAALRQMRASGHDCNSRHKCFTSFEFRGSSSLSSLPQEVPHQCRGVFNRGRGKCTPSHTHTQTIEVFLLCPPVWRVNCQRFQCALVSIIKVATFCIHLPKKRTITIYIN